VRAVDALRRAMESPSSAGHLLDRAAGILRAQFLLRGAALGDHVYAGPGLLVDGDGDLIIGDRVALHGGIVASALSCARGARLEIGSESIFNYGVRIHARAFVKVGSRCRFGSMVYVSDTGRHGTRSVVVEDDVWLAHGAIIEPGVRVGAGSVVSAGSVVTSDVPPASMAVGNPARSLPLRLVDTGSHATGPLDALRNHCVAGA
jgi:acetyltransferase-like isoleucine patch superfamily enzyme